MKAEKLTAPLAIDSSTRAVITSTEENWASLLGRAGLWAIVDAKAAAFDSKRAANPSILILVDLGEASGQAAAVEALIDALLVRGPAQIRVGASADSSAMLAANRDVYALADIAGYRYMTDAGNEYDIVDLAEDERADVFPVGSVLHGTSASAAWIDADLRIVYAAATFDRLDGFGGALDTLICALPKTDKDLHYRLRRDAGEVVAALLASIPPDFALLDWHDPQQRGKKTGDGLRLAGASPLLVDMAGALKLGLDPFDVPMLARVAKVDRLAPDFLMEGDLTPISTRAAPSALARKGRTSQMANEAIARLAQGWALPRDTINFPLQRPINAQASRLLGPPATKDRGMQPMIAALMGVAAQSMNAWQAMFAKDMLVRRTVSLDIDPATVPDADFGRMVAELDALAPIATAAPERAEGLRWRKWERAILFAFERTLAIPFDHFVGAVDVSRAISFMNDYLGGVIVASAFDDRGRPIRQAERNLYLPQPNYLALYGGQPIDVSKIEVACYGADEHRLTWKTVNSTNGSAEADDGYVSFSRTDGGTRVTIIGKQLFTLPPFWRVFDLSLFPAIEEPLTTLAYQHFFGRTLNNFEALVEGRDVRLGRDPGADTDHPSAMIEATVTRLAQLAAPFVEKLQLKPSRFSQADADGFVHVVPGT